MSKSGNINEYEKIPSNYSDPSSKSFMLADKIDLQIIKELLIDPNIEAFEICTKLKVPLALIHRKKKIN